MCFKGETITCHIFALTKPLTACLATRGFQFSCGAPPITSCLTLITNRYLLPRQESVPSKETSKVLPRFCRDSYRNQCRIKHINASFPTATHCFIGFMLGIGLVQGYVWDS
jgi:hypothetical protein